MAEMTVGNVNLLVGYVCIFCGTMVFMVRLSWQLVVANLVVMPLMLQLDRVFGCYYEVSYLLLPFLICFYLHVSPLQRLSIMYLV